MAEAHISKLIEEFEFRVMLLGKPVNVAVLNSMTPGVQKAFRNARRAGATTQSLRGQLILLKDRQVSIEVRQLGFLRRVKPVKLLTADALARLAGLMWEGIKSSKATSHSPDKKAALTADALKQFNEVQRPKDPLEVKIYATPDQPCPANPKDTKHSSWLTPAASLTVASAPNHSPRGNESSTLLIDPKCPATASGSAFDCSPHPTQAESTSEHLPPQYAVQLMCIHVRVFSSGHTDMGTQRLQVHPHDTVTDVKRRIHSLTQIPVDEQRLVCHGESLEGGSTLGDCGVGPEATVQVVPRWSGYQVAPPCRARPADASQKLQHSKMSSSVLIDV